MTPKPQDDKTIDEKITYGADYGTKDGDVSAITVMKGITVILVLTGEPADAVLALMTKARANERQAMLDTLPKRKKMPQYGGVYDYEVANTKGWNECCDEMESAIKKREMSDE